MENQNEIIDDNNIEQDNDVEIQQIISLNTFIFLSIISFGLYQIWWIYKSWRFFQQKDKLDIMPAVRALFSIIFLIPLINKINAFAKVKGYKGGYSSVLLFICFIAINLLVYLPTPFWLIAIFSFVCLIQPFKALNFAKQQSEELKVVIQHTFSGGQIVLSIIGAIFWALVLLGLGSK